MKQTDLDIDAIVISSPCDVPWDSMTGDDVRRFCGTCRLHVYDLSQMTRAEIRKLHAATGGEFCKRVWRRPDGRVVTRDCGRVARAIRRRLRAVGAAAAGLLAMMGLLGCASRSRCAQPCSEGATPAPPAESGAQEAPAPKATVITGR